MVVHTLSLPRVEYVKVYFFNKFSSEAIKSKNVPVKINSFSNIAKPLYEIPPHNLTTHNEKSPTSLAGDAGLLIQINV